MSKRGETAVEVLKAGGYFRKALERHWHGGEKFATRLRTADGAVVPGVGGAALRELEGKGLLKKRPCAKSSVWPEEWVLSEEVR